MAFEVPTDLIRDVQIMLRKHAGIPTYNPADSSLPSLPSLSDAISGFEPSPPHPYLRCKHCNGKFLRGSASLICVYCGLQQRRDLPPEPIKFKSTISYRWLLDALDLDGSEIVGPSAEESELSRGQTSRQKDEVSLSDLLDLEIKWSDVYEKVEDDITNNKNTSAFLNLAGVGLANYFTEPNNDNTVDASKKQFSEITVSSTSQGRKDLNLFENVPSVNESSDRFADWEINSTESSSIQGHKNLHLVADVPPSETGASSTNDKSGDRFSGWEAEFQSASSETIHRDPSSFDPFVVPTVDLSVHMDTVFGSGIFANQEKPKEDSVPSASTASNWAEDDDDVWSGFNSGVSNQAETIEATSISRLQDDNWKISSTNVPNDDNDSFDTWNDFTSSTNKQELTSSPWSQNRDQVISSNEHTSEQNLFSSTNNFQSTAFGNFAQPDLVTAAFINKNDSKEVNIMHLEALELDRNEGSAKAGVRIGQDDVKATTSSEAEDVEMLMSQMHDLSFMLETNLSLPKS